MAIQLPTEITKPLDEIKTPSNRLLVVILILAVIVLFGLLINNLNGNSNENKEEKKEEHVDNIRLRRENDSLRFTLLQYILADNERLRDKSKGKDTVINNLQTKKLNNEKN